MVASAWGAAAKPPLVNYCHESYSTAIKACGAASLLIPTDQDPSDLQNILQRIDGLILGGGVDIHPRRYGEMPLPGLGEVDDLRDRMEISAVHQALKLNLPLLAICRGIQVLNVTLGGSLYQDITRQQPEALLHAPSVDKAVATHTVALTPETCIQRLMGRRRIWVNSQHHQAILKPAPGLRVTGLAPDGIIEAVELPEHRFVMGVQWHPEGTLPNDRYAKKLFQALVQAADDRQTKD
jgi:gamma-glutamyl-gamma-aminobutyrate hydrolase PuuD